MARDTYRLSQLPPYVLARVDELKSRLRAEGRDVFDFGLGNPDGPSPAAVVARLQAELGKAGFQRYQPSRGLPVTRMRGFRTEYDTSTSRLMSTYAEAVMSTTPCTTG